MRTSRTTRSGRCPATAAQQVLGVRKRGDDLVPAVFEEARQALPQEHLVLRYHYSHGSSAVRTVPRSGLLSIESSPPWAAARSARPRSPEPLVAEAPPIPSSEIETVSFPFRRSALKVTWRASECLTALVSPSLAMKYAAASISCGKRSPFALTWTGSGARAASSLRAGVSPASSCAGRTPLASSWSSSIATSISVTAPSIESLASSGETASSCCAWRRARPIVMSRCWAPSCRSRSSRRRSW